MKTRVMLSVLLVALFSLILTNLTVLTIAASGDDQLNRSDVVQVFGDYILASVPMRGQGSGALDFVGLPDGARVVQATLYWATIG